MKLIFSQDRFIVSFKKIFLVGIGVIIIGLLAISNVFNQFSIETLTKKALPFSQSVVSPLSIPSQSTLSPSSTKLILASATASLKGTENLMNHDGIREIFPADSKRNIAEKIMEIQRQISRLAGKNSIIDPKWALQLLNIAKDLDPRIPESNTDDWEYSAYLKSQKIPMKTVSNKSRSVCPEVYDKNIHKDFGQHGIDAIKCNYVPLLSNIIIFILPAFNLSDITIHFVIDQIRKIYDVPIIVVSNRNTSLTTENKNVLYISYPNKADGALMNLAVEKVTTEFVFIGTSLQHFNNQSSIERLIRVLDDLENIGVAVAGGAARDLDGRWITGCIQSELKYYRAFFEMGYHYSKHECMFCDDLLGPFVTRKNTLLNFNFDQDIYGPIVYRDWFIKVKQNGLLSTICPDVMFYISNHPLIEKNDWKIFAVKYSLLEIQTNIFDRNLYTFSCNEVKISCKNHRKLTESYFLPYCCLSQMNNIIQLVIQYAKINRIDYELQAGTALGAVKFGNILPWDIDSDIIINCQDWNIWMIMEVYLKKSKCKLRKRSNRYFQIFCGEDFADVYCHSPTSTKYLPEEYKNTPTKILFHGNWTNIISNPGLYARNSYGFHCLRHAVHWRNAPASNFIKELGWTSYISTSSWPRCKNPLHHSCQDKFPTDGNLDILYIRN